MNSPALAVLVVVAATLQAPPQASAIATAKKAIVQELDNALGRVAFETWVRGLVGSQADMNWEVNDCGEQTGSAADRERDLPLCTEVRVDISGGRRLSLSLLVGSRNKGLTVGPLTFYHGYISGPKGSEMIPIMKLSDVPQLLGQPK